MQRMCSMCREEKEESEFYYNKKLHRFDSYCKNCKRLYENERRKVHRKIKERNHYAIYKGETFLFEGTVKECAEHFNVKERTIYFLTSPALHKRANEKWKVAIKIDDEKE